MYWWVQIEEDNVAEYGKKYGLLTNTGYKYKCPLTGVNMVEYHVDSCQKNSRNVEQNHGMGRKFECYNASWNKTSNTGWAR